MEIDTIIWDWNGTLLNDVDISIEAINLLLAARSLPLLNKESYLQVFGFPVQDYYERIGFNFNEEPFEIPAHQYIEKYSSLVKQGKLHHDVPELLKEFENRGYKQFVLSASEQHSLDELLKYFGIRKWFKAVAGLNNHYAESKEEIGIHLLNRNHILPESACLIGDTTHDFDVAHAMGCQCILIANGHQSFEKLKETGAKVLHKLKELREFFKK